MTNKETILTVDNLNVSYDKNKIITNLSFSVKRKDVLIILGPNGAGKSTLLKAILNLIPYTGTVKWNSNKISYLPPQEQLQRKNLPPLSIEEFFNFKTKDHNKIVEILSEVGLDPQILPRQFGALSTGQFQRMSIAWALIDEPEVLIIDEPTSGIDIGGEETIYNLIHKFWKKYHMTILMVTHDLNIVWEHANNVLCINKQYSCMGTPEEILSPEQLKKLYGTGLKYYKHHHDHKYRNEK